MKNNQLKPLSSDRIRGRILDNARKVDVKGNPLFMPTTMALAMVAAAI